MKMTWNREPRTVIRVIAKRWNVKQSSRLAVLPPLLHKHTHTHTHTPHTHTAKQ